MSGIFRPLRADEIECRVQQVKQDGLVLLLYKDARCDQNILDETVGPYNWQRHHSRDNANCTVLIWDTEKCMWVGKEDTGTESNTEAQKGLASDSFKRACFNWGIGRELYSAPFIWIPSSACNIRDNKGRPACYDRFRVSSIEYDNGNVSSLVIYNATTRSTCYQFGKPSQAQPQQYEQKYVCDRCTLPVKSVPGKGGKTLSPAQIVAESKKRFNAIYCADCMKRMMEAQKQREQSGN